MSAAALTALLGSGTGGGALLNAGVGAASGLFGSIGANKRQKRAIAAQKEENRLAREWQKEMAEWYNRVERENVRKHEKIFYGTEYEGLLSQAEENSVMKMEEAERMQEPESEWEPEFMQVQEQNRREPERRRMPNWLQNLIEVMLYHELYKRRSDHRRSRHRIY